MLFNQLHHPTGQALPEYLWLYAWRPQIQAEKRLLANHAHRQIPGPRAFFWPLSPPKKASQAHNSCLLLGLLGLGIGGRRQALSKP
jgi:hypothetical protein